MADEFMYIPNDDILTPSLDNNLLMDRLYIQLNQPTNPNLMKFPNVVKPAKSFYYNSLGTSVITAQFPLPPCIKLNHIKCI